MEHKKILQVALEKTLEELSISLRKIVNGLNTRYEESLALVIEEREEQIRKAKAFETEVAYLKEELRKIE